MAMLHAVVFPTLLLAALADPHPVLPKMWRAVTKEDEVGVVFESENFVDDHEITAENPDAKWTNKTDGSCQRLIYKSPYEDKRYLLKCDAVDCCEEDGDGTVEYQIPNVHPAVLAPVHHLGQKTFERFDGVSVTADVYEWKFLTEKTTAYVTNGTGPNSTAVLQKWEVEIDAQTYPNQYANYTEVPASEAAAFKASFHIPQICKGNILRCDNAHRKGLLSAKSLRFLRAGRKSSQKMQRPRAGCGLDLGEVEVGLALALLGGKNAISDCNKDTECRDAIGKINAQVEKLVKHVASANTNCDTTVPKCAASLSKLTESVDNAASKFDQSTTACDKGGGTLCEVSIGTGGLALVAAEEHCAGAIKGCS